MLDDREVTHEDPLEVFRKRLKSLDEEEFRKVARIGYQAILEAFQRGMEERRKASKRSGTRLRIRAPRKS